LYKNKKVSRYSYVFLIIEVRDIMGGTREDQESRRGDLKAGDPLL
jgi:hypothetical protein